MKEISVLDIFITTKELVLLMKYSPNNQILDLGVILYIYYNINLFNYLALTSTKIVQSNVINLLIYNINTITIKLLNLVRVILKSILYILELKLNLVSLTYLI